MQGGHEDSTSNSLPMSPPLASRRPLLTRPNQWHLYRLLMLAPRTSRSVQEPPRQPQFNRYPPAAQPIWTIAGSYESRTPQPRADYTLSAPSLKLRSNFEHLAKPLVAVISSVSPVATRQQSRCVNIPLVLVLTILLILLTINRIARRTVSWILSPYLLKDLTSSEPLGPPSQSPQAPQAEAPRAPKALSALKRASTPFAPKSSASTPFFALNSATSSWSAISSSP